MIVSGLMALLEWGVAALGVAALAAATVARDPFFLVPAAVAVFAAMNLRGLAMTRALNRRIDAGLIAPVGRAGEGDP